MASDEIYILGGLDITKFTISATVPVICESRFMGRLADVPGV